MNMSPNRRKSSRFDSLHFLEYLLRNAAGEIVARGLGRTLNVSAEGLLLETHVAFVPGQRLTLTLGLEDELVDLQAQVVRVEPGGEGFRVALVLSGTDAGARAFLQRYLQALENAPN